MNRRSFFKGVIAAGIAACVPATLISQLVPKNTNQFALSGVPIIEDPEAYLTGINQALYDVYAYPLSDIAPVKLNMFALGDA